MKFLITPRLLFMMFPLRTQTLVNVYPLPRIPNQVQPKCRGLLRSHCGAYPHPISTLQIVETSVNSDLSISFLALVYVTRSPTSWTSRIGLHLFDVNLESTGTLSFLTTSIRTLNVGIATTTLGSSSRAGSCLAVTHSLPGPKILLHYIQHHHHAKSTMAVKALTLPEGLQSRDMLSFDGVEGRLCLINGWTNIEILDFL